VWNLRTDSLCAYGRTRSECADHPDGTKQVIGVQKPKHGLNAFNARTWRYPLDILSVLARYRSVLSRWQHLLVSDMVDFNTPFAKGP